MHNSNRSLCPVLAVREGALKTTTFQSGVTLFWGALFKYIQFDTNRRGSASARLVLHRRMYVIQILA